MGRSIFSKKNLRIQVDRVLDSESHGGIFDSLAPIGGELLKWRIFDETPFRSVSSSKCLNIGLSHVWSVLIWKYFIFEFSHYRSSALSKYHIIEVYHLRRVRLSKLFIFIVSHYQNDPSLALFSENFIDYLTISKSSFHFALEFSTTSDHTVGDLFAW